MRPAMFVVLSVVASTACASSGNHVDAPVSALFVRSSQTRVFETEDRRAVISALMQGLEDAGFQVAQVDAEIGFVSANAEHVEGKGGNVILKGVFWPYAIMFPKLFAGNRKHTVVEATGTVIEDAKTQRVRLACRVKVTDGDGGVKELRDVQDPKFYQSLFARIDKALYLHKEGL